MLQVLTLKIIQTQQYQVFLLAPKYLWVVCDFLYWTFRYFPGPIFPEQTVSCGTSCLDKEAFQIAVYINCMSSSATCALMMPVDKFSACLSDGFSWGLHKNGLEMEHLQRSRYWQKKALQWDVKYVHCNLYRQLASGKLDLWPVEDRNISKETTEAATGTQWDRDGGTNYIFAAVTPMLEVCWWQMTLWWTAQ